MTYRDRNVTAVIPVKWQSRRLPGKNFALLDDTAAIMSAIRLVDRSPIDQIIVLADEESSRVLDPTASRMIYVIDRDDEWLNCTIDHLVASYPGIPATDWLVVVQPNVVTADDTLFARWLNVALDRAATLKAPVFATVPSDHIMWRGRQRHFPDEMRMEVGWRVYPARARRDTTTRPAQVPIPDSYGQVWDIDRPHELAAARASILRCDTHVAFWALSAEEGFGSGHEVRCQTIADALARTGLVESISVHLGPTVPTPSARHSAIVVDRLDTTEEMVDTLRDRGWGRVVTLEDRGSGAKLADDTINALYEDGPDWFVLRTEFLCVDPKPYRPHAVMVSFGGVDEARHTEQVVAALESLETDVAIWVVDPPRRRSSVDRQHLISDIDGFSMAKAMARARVLVTGRGRTAFEAAWMRLPVVSLAANQRETLHPVPWAAQAAHPADAASLAVEIVDDPELWHRMSAAGRRAVDGRGTWRLVQRIVEHVQEARWENTRKK